MICRVITLKYDPDLCGFPEEPLRDARYGMNLRKPKRIG